MIDSKNVVFFVLDYQVLLIQSFVRILDSLKNLRESHLLIDLILDLYSNLIDVPLFQIKFFLNPLIIFKSHF